MSATNPSTEYEALLHVVTRLASRFRSVDEHVVRDIVIEEFIAFDGAWLRHYVPVLVEGRALRRLRSLASRDSSGRHDEALAAAG